MKTWIRIVVTVLVLMAGTGCVILSDLDEMYWNELTRCFAYEADGASVLCIEQASGSANGAPDVRDVYVMSDAVVQTYRIENRKVFDCRWVDCSSPAHEDNKIWGEEPLAIKAIAMYKAHQQQPNRLKQSGAPFKPLTGSPAVTVTAMSYYPFAPPFDSRLTEKVAWSYWTVWQWAGAPDETPADAEEFRQIIGQAVSSSGVGRKHHSYLRAVPLFTEEELEAEKDTPLIDWDKVRYHTQFATRYPYLLVPIPGRGSPFFSGRTHKPGDKFRVRNDYESKPRYFLIETFVGARSKR